MSAGLAAPSPDELEQLRERVRRLGEEKSFLQLVICLMNSISAVSGLEQVVDNLLQAILNGIGGRNILLYYCADGDLLRADVYGNKAALEAIDDPLVEAAMAGGAPVELEHDFADTAMMTREFGKAYTWIYPLAVGATVIGALRIESLHLTMRGLEQPLATFFGYVALVLKNEIAGQSRLHRMCEDLSAANQRLAHEIAERRIAQEALAKALAETEDRVRERTAELRQANQELEAEIQERLQAEAALQRESSITAALARLYRTLASSESAIGEIACQVLEEARSLTGSLHGFVSEISPSTASHICHTFSCPGEHSQILDRQNPIAFPRQRDGSYCEPWGKALSAREPFFLNELAPPRLNGTAEGPVALENFLAVPVILGKAPAGLVVLANKRGGYGDGDLAAVGRIAEYYAIAIQRKRAEATIRHLASFPQLSPMLIAEFNRAGELVYQSPAMQAAVARWNLSGAHQFVPPDWLDRVGQAAGTTPGAEVREIELEGRSFEIRILFTLESETLRIYASDVTERKQAEAEQARLGDQLQQAQKMEAIGRLAGGVAHDFNNLLTVINGYCDLALARCPTGAPLHAEMQQIRCAGDRAANLTRQLLAFSRRQPLETQPLNLNQVVEEAIKILQRVIGEDIELACQLDPQLGTVRADPGQLHQVLMNLVVNARDAMPSGGRLVIETANARLEPDSTSGPRVSEPGDYVLLGVSDSGTGMTPEVMSRVFEPFYTTKERGKGTGLGLATVFGIVKQSGGHLSLCSEPGHGTRFRIYLPRVREAPASGTAYEAPLARGSETLLVVEDQPEVRALTRAVLQSFGYQVLEAGNGVEALRVFQEAPARIDMVVTDVVMPQMNGPQLAGRLQRLLPGMPVLFLSGHVGGADLEASGVAQPHYLPKPFKPAALARKVREILDGAHPADSRPYASILAQDRDHPVEGADPAEWRRGGDSNPG